MCFPIFLLLYFDFLLIFEDLLLIGKDVNNRMFHTLPISGELYNFIRILKSAAILNILKNWLLLLIKFY